MICPSCKAENIEGADQCDNCGEPLYGLDIPDLEADSSVPAFIKQPISNLAMRTLLTVATGDPVGLAVRMMQNEKIGSVLVLDDGNLAGILTSWDILHKVAGPTEDLNAVTCGEVMTADPICLNDSDSLALALNVMSAGGFRHVPVLKDGKPVAVLGVGDVFGHISGNRA